LTRREEIAAALNLQSAVPIDITNAYYLADAFILPLVQRAVWEARQECAWTAAGVFGLLERHGLPANPLYKLGAGRVGCFPCVLTRHAELRRLGAMLPEVWDRIAELERLSGRSYFPPEFIPARFCSHSEEQWVEAEPGDEPTLFAMPSEKRLVKHIAYWPSIADVRRYIEEHPDELHAYGETPACLSVYNLCER